MDFSICHLVGLKGFKVPGFGENPWSTWLTVMTFSRFAGRKTLKSSALARQPTANSQ